MKILLILPPSVNVIEPFVSSEKKQFPLLLGFPLGLGYIASYLLKLGHEVRLIDANIENMTMTQIMMEVYSFKPDYVGMTLYTINSKVGVVIAKNIQNFFPYAKIVVGGPHASDDYENLLAKYPYFDYAVIGEGEETFAELVEGNKTAKGLAYLENGKVVFTGERPLRENIDLFPPPARHLVPFERYIHAGTLLPFSVEIMGSRGCTNRCVFCSFQKSWRTRTSLEITKEMKSLAQTYPQTKTFLFYDDNFTADKTRVLDLCKTIIDEGLNKYKWSCLARADKMDEEMVFWMKQAGCSRILIGLETADPKIMKNLNKHLNPQKVKEVVGIVNKHKIDALVFFIVGNPGETYDTLKTSYNFAKQLKCHSTFWSIMQVFPGTQLAKLQPCEDFTGYLYGPEVKEPCVAIGATVPAFENPNMNREDLKRLYKKFFRSIVIYKALRYPGFTLRKFLPSPKKALGFLLGLFKCQN